jgi:hypothetical protein
MTRFLPILLAFSLRGCTPCPAAGVDFNRLAQTIYRAEGGNKTRFAYGVERIGRDGKRYPYPSAIAKSKCLETCRGAHKRWIKSGCKGDFIEFLGKTYAQDPLWGKKVKWLYSRYYG